MAKSLTSCALVTPINALSWGCASRPRLLEESHGCETLTGHVSSLRLAR
ncbi:MAG: hypothetical protein JWM91_4580 [Rhodospirillales bacterium]|nr:hypothetical protein [Rhodospirillales bacterium]